MTSCLFIYHVSVNTFLCEFSDGVRESHVVSKTFDVEQLPPDEQYHEDDGTRFIRDIPHAHVCHLISSCIRWVMYPMYRLLVNIREFHFLRLEKL